MTLLQKYDEALESILEWINKYQATRDELISVLKDRNTLRQEFEALKDSIRGTVEKKQGYYRRYGRKKSSVKLKVIQGGVKA